MDENTTGFLFDISMAILFIAALSLFLVIYPKTVNNLKLLKNSVNSERAIQVDKNGAREYTVSGAEIIGNIHAGQDTQVYVSDGSNSYLVYKKYKDTYDEDQDGDIDEEIEKADYSKIDAGSDYVVEKFVEDGKIVSIEYHEK